MCDAEDGAFFGEDFPGGVVRPRSGSSVVEKHLTPGESRNRKLDFHFSGLRIS